MWNAKSLKKVQKQHGHVIAFTNGKATSTDINGIHWNSQYRRLGKCLDNINSTDLLLLIINNALGNYPVTISL